MMTAKPIIHIAGPQIVQSPFVVQAKRVTAKVMPAVQKAAASTICGSYVEDMMETR